MRSWIPTVVSLSNKLVENILLLRWNPRQGSLNRQVQSLWTSEVLMFIQKEPVLIRSEMLSKNFQALFKGRVTSLNGSMHVAFSLDTSILDFPRLLGTRSRISQSIVGTSLVGETGLIFNPQADHEAMKDMLPYRTCNKWLKIGMYSCTHATNCWMFPYRTCYPSKFPIKRQKASPSDALIASHFQIYWQRLVATSRRIWVLLSTSYWHENDGHKASILYVYIMCFWQGFADVIKSRMVVDIRLY